MRELPGLEKEIRSAVFSDCRAYRYTLRIVWDESKPTGQFIGLNPSTADEVQDDPTVRRCKDYCKSWGLGGLIMTNLFAFRATDPEVMKARTRPIGEQCFEELPYSVLTDEVNDWHILQTAASCQVTVAAWGIHGAFMNRGADMVQLCKMSKVSLKCLGVTASGHPKHPLYLAKQTPLIDFVGLGR